MKFRKILAGALACAMLAGAALAETIDANSAAEQIRGVQTKLEAMQLLTNDDLTGVWTDDTTLAVVRFQRFVNNAQGAGTVEENGVVDDRTQPYLDYAAANRWNIAAQVPAGSVTMPTPEDPEAAAAAAEAAAKAKAEADAATIAYVQSMLRQIGLLDEVNGEYTEETRQAIIAIQEYINTKYGPGTVQVNGAYDDSYTMAYLNKAAEERWEVPKPGAKAESDAEAGGEGDSGDGQTDGSAAQATAVPNPSAIQNFVIMLNGQPTEGTVEVAAGTYNISWTGTNVAMFSMYMYDANGNLLNKEENMSVNNFNLNTFGMAVDSTYEVRIGAVPNGGQVADMEWRSLFLKLK